jgi:hypothetical protein
MKTVSINFQDADLERLDAYAEKHRLKRNAAVLRALDAVLDARKAAACETAASPSAVPPAKLALGKAVLSGAQKYAGVHPVALEGDELSKIHDPDAERGLSEFYGKKDSPVAKSEPEGWEDPP